MQLLDGESIGEYVVRLERRLKELEPPEGFTIQEWHVGQVYTYLLWMDEGVRENDSDAAQKWRDRLTMFEDRFPEQVSKFAAYMGWEKRPDLQKSPAE